MASIVIVLGALILFAPYLLRKGDPLTSVADATPELLGLSPSTVFPLAAHQRACMSTVTVTHNSRGAAFQLPLGAGVEPQGPPLELLLTGPGYRATSHLPAGGYARLVEFSITPPRHTLIATVCVVNQGAKPVPLQGTTTPRSVSRSQLTIGGKAVFGNLTLIFLDTHRPSRIGRLGEVFEHVSNLTDRLVPVWLVWILAVLTALAVPVGIVIALARALQEDEAAA